MAGDDKKSNERVRFELEDDAEELFRKALENIDPSVKPDVTEAAKEAVRTTPKPKPPYEIDLHGLTLPEAEAAVDRFLIPLLQAASGRVEVTFITGKGRHSGPGGAVLPRAVHHYVKTKWGRYIERIDSSPADAHIGGVPIRGHFRVKFSW